MRTLSPRGGLYLETVLLAQGDGLLIAASSWQNCLSMKVIGHIRHCVHCHSVHIQPRRKERFKKGVGFRHHAVEEHT